MFTKARLIKIFVLAIICLATVNLASADTVRGIGIDFVSIGNAGNSADTTGYGAVSYGYRIGKYETTNAQWNAFTAAAGAPTGNPSNAYDQSAYYTGAQQPANNVSWYEAAQFCNWLTSGNKSKGAYQFSGTNTNPSNFLGINRTAAQTTYGTIYVIPTENEWYKAAYYKPNGSGYSLYANGINTIPAADNGWNYSGGSYSTPWNVGTGTQEQNGTFDMMGNVSEWNETLFYGSERGYRGASFADFDYNLASSFQGAITPSLEGSPTGFRIAEIPEPATICLFAIAGLILRNKK